MSFIDLSVQGLGGWVRLVVGAAILLLPGIALARRLMPHERAGLLLAPVCSLTLLVLSLMGANIFVGVPLNTFTVAAFALAWTTILGWRDVRRLLRREHRTWHAWRTIPWRKPVPYLLLAAAAFAVLVHATPHIPGSDADGPAGTYRELGSRALDGAQGRDYPYPIHVDEHFHLAVMAQMVRDEEVDVENPYTGLPADQSLLSVSGFRQERGFDTAIVAIHLLTGAPFGALFRFLPALWAGYLATTVWLAMRPAHGALPAAALVSILPSSARFLGPAFLISSPFALPWIFATVTVGLRGSPGGRFFGVLVLVTGAFFLHLVIGTLCVAAALLCMLLGRGDWRDRAGMAVAALVPLLWVVPGAWEDIVGAVSGSHDLPFAPAALSSTGPFVASAAVLGAGLAFARPTHQNAPVRVLGIIALATGASMYVSILMEHRSDATYSRLLFAFLLGLACLAGHGISKGAWLATRLARTRTRWIPPAGAVAAVLLVLVLPSALGHNLQDPYYRIHDEESWAAAQVLARHAAPTDQFLAHPWQAPVMNTASGARPYAVLYPGNVPYNEDEYLQFMRTGDVAWLQERSIDFVVAPPRPVGTALGSDVYRVPGISL